MPLLYINNAPFGGKMESVAEEYEKFLKERNDIQTLNQLKYIQSFYVIRKAYLSGEISCELLDKINNKNAEICGCFPIDFKY